MNMNGSMGTMDVVVFLALGFAVVLVVAWSVSPALRAWIERPKYRFQENLRSYDEGARTMLRDRKGPR